MAEEPLHGVGEAPHLVLVEDGETMQLRIALPSGASPLLMEMRTGQFADSIARFTEFIGKPSGEERFPVAQVQSTPMPAQRLAAHVNDDKIVLSVTTEPHVMHRFLATPAECEALRLQLKSAVRIAKRRPGGLIWPARRRMDPDAFVRLGRVVHWSAAAIAIAILAWAYAASNGQIAVQHNDTLTWPIAEPATRAAFVYIAGRGFRYIVAGE